MTAGLNIEDPDVVQAIEDLWTDAAEIRNLSDRIAGEHACSPQRRHGERHIGELTSRIRLRAGRIGVSPDALMILLNNEASRRAARKGRGVAAPVTGLRAMLDAVSEANAREAASHIALTAAQAEMRAATAARLGAEEAYRIAAGRPLAQPFSAPSTTNDQTIAAAHPSAL